jgi:hypothetical protein
MDVPASFHALVIAKQAELKIARGRNVTIAETLEYLSALIAAIEAHAPAGGAS